MNFKEELENLRGCVEMGLLTRNDGKPVTELDLIRWTQVIVQEKKNVEATPILKSETRERKEYVDRWNNKLVNPSFTTEEYEKERSKHEITDVPRKHL